MGAWTAPQALSRPEDTMLPATARSRTLSAPNKSSQFSPSARLCLLHLGRKTGAGKACAHRQSWRDPVLPLLQAEQSLCPRPLPMPPALQLPPSWGPHRPASMLPMSAWTRAAGAQARPPLGPEEPLPCGAARTLAGTARPGSGPGPLTQCLCQPGPGQPQL